MCGNEANGADAAVWPEPYARICDGCGADSPHVRLYGADTRLCPGCRAKDQERWDALVGDAVEGAVPI